MGPDVPGSVRPVDHRRRLSRPPAPLSSLLLAALLSASCATDDASTEDGATPDPVVVVDADGRTVSLVAPATRVVSLVPSATETLHAIGAASTLVGRTDFDAQPWAEAVPSVGGGLEPSLEVLVSLDPDLVIRFAGEQDPRTAERLDDLGIPYVSVRPDRLEDILAIARLLGRATGYGEEGEALAVGLRDQLDEVAVAVAELPRIRVAYVLGGAPPWVSGSSTYISDVLALAGGDNVFTDLTAHYAPISPEELLSRDIEAVVVSGAASFEPRWLPDARVIDVGGVLEIPGPSVVDGAWVVAELLHGRPLR